MSRSNVSSCRFLPLRVGKPLFMDASIVLRSRGVQFFGARFCYIANGDSLDCQDWAEYCYKAETNEMLPEHCEIATIFCVLCAQKKP